MKKNTSGQKIGAQLVSATDGSAFTGSVTVYVTLDAGTQAVGSVGSGACTHEGNGYHTYAPAQSETNGDLVSFTFTGTGAVPVTVQVYTTFPQTGDSFDRLGSAGAGLTALPWNAAWDTEVQSECADALTAYDPPTNAEMEARTIAAADYATATNLATVAGYLDTEIQTIITNLATVDTVVDAILVDTDTTIPALIDALPTAAENAAALLDLSDGVEVGLTPRQALRLFAAALGGVLSGADTTTITIKGAGVATARVTATVDSDGNRSAVTLNL